MQSLLQFLLQFSLQFPLQFPVQFSLIPQELLPPVREEKMPDGSKAIANPVKSIISANIINLFIIYPLVSQTLPLRKVSSLLFKIHCGIIIN
jgi:hypothetical protein